MSPESNNSFDSSDEASSSQSMAERSSEHDYQIGFGKPPKATQFKKGQSGNPKGRKKRQPVEDVRGVIEDIFAEPVLMREGKKVRKVSKLEAMMETHRRNALQGDKKSMRALLKAAKKTGLFSHAKPQSCIVLEPGGNEEEQMILREFHAEQDASHTRAD